MYQAQFDGKTFTLEHKADGMQVNGEKLEWDLVALGDGQFHIRYQQRSYPAEVVRIDRETKTVELKVRGQRYSVRLRDDVDLLMEKMGMSAAGSSKVNSIKAPMPGLIIDLRVQAGDEVKPGDALLILEAMKMENILKSPGAGTVKKVRIKKGDSVEKGQVLIEF
jgi:biotin carboxyl carrier protein